TRITEITETQPLVDLETKALIVQLGLDLTLPKAFQKRSWPYHFRADRLEPVQKLLKRPPLNETYDQVVQLSQLIKKKHFEKYGNLFSFSECIDGKEHLADPFVTFHSC